MGKVKKILTIEDLIKFCEQNKFTKFDAKESGYQLCVQVPSITFEIDEDNSRQGLMKIKVKVAHTGKNRNKSHISKENMEKAMPSLKNRPVLAAIHQLDSGEYDFEAHNMEIEVDEDGNERTVYIERQVGSFTEEDPYLEYDAEKDVYVVIATAVIPEDYTMAADILRRKNGTKESCELCINAMSYNAKEGYLDLQDFYFAAGTLLGSKKNGEEIGEGMLGSRADITDFSKENNSIINQSQDANSKLIETLENLNKTLSNFNINKTEASESQKEHYEEGGQSVEDNKLNNETQVNEEDTELNAETDTEVKVDTDESKETDDTVTETEACGGGKKKKKKNNSDETDDGADDTTDEVDDTASETDTVDESEITDISEVTDESEVLADETEEDGEVDTELPVDNTEDLETEENPDDSEETPEENVSDDDEGSKKKKVENSLSKSFEISHDDIRYALYNLLSAYEDEDNDWYWIVEVFDNHFIYQGCTGNYFGQKYKVENEDVSFEGERYELFVEFLTKSEKTELDSMRSNYSSIMSELNTYKSNEINAQKEEIISDDAYAEFIETDEFKNIKEKFDSYSIDELRTACDLAFAKCVKAKGNFSFSANTKEKETKKVNKIGINANFEVNDNEPYGDYFNSLKRY